MEVTFGTRQLQRTCESASEMRRTYGAACAKKLMLRLTELRAAPCLDDLRQLGGRCQELDAGRYGELALDLSKGRRLVFAPTAATSPKGRRRPLDWRGINAVEVIEIADDHNG
jgi:proteic killer suppression protein